jgi:hypothetical protein
MLSAHIIQFMKSKDALIIKPGTELQFYNIIRHRVKENWLKLVRSTTNPEVLISDSISALEARLYGITPVAYRYR